MNKARKIYLATTLIIIVIIISLSLPFFLAKSSLAYEVNSLRKAGFPVISQEFAEKYYKPIPKNQNALEIFETALSLLQEPNYPAYLIIQGNAKAPWLDQKLAPELSIVAKKYVTENTDFFKEIEKLKKYNYLRFNYDWKYGYRWRQIPANELRKIFNFYAIKTELAINRNDSQQVKKFLNHMFHVNKLIRQEPSLLAQLVSQACECIIIIRLERYMNMCELSSEDLKYFMRVCAENERYFIAQWPKMWQEIIVMLIDFGNPDALKKNGLFEYSSNNISKSLFAAQFEFLSGNMNNKLVREIKWNKEIMHTPLDVYKKRKHNLEKIANEAKNVKILGASFSTSMCALIYKKMLKMIAYLRCARTACAVRRFQLKYGKLPKTLHDLVPEFLPTIPLDPFDGNTLRYFHGSFKVKYEIPIISDKKHGDSLQNEPDVFQKVKPIYKSVILKKAGFYVYSVGENLTDDICFPLFKNSSESKDITFVIIEK